MKNIIKECFKWEGRWNRKKFWLYPLIFLIPYFLIGLIGAIFYTNEIITKIVSVLNGILGLVVTYVGIASYVKRLRDLDKNPWLVLLLFIPFANIYLFVICGFFKGTTGLNKYGPDPLKPNLNAENNNEKIEL